MMLAPLVLAVLAVSPGTIAVPPFRGAGLDPAVGVRAAEQLGQALAVHHYDVVGPARLAQALSVSQQRALAACAPEAGLCFGRFLEALGSQSLVVGLVSTVDQRLLLEVRLLAGADMRVQATGRAQAAGVEGLEAAVQELALALLVDFEAAPAPPAPPAPPTLGAAFWTPVVSGAVLMVAGGIELGVALTDLDRIRQARGVTLLEPEASGQLEMAIKQRNVGIAGMSLGAVSILVGALFGRPASTVTVSPTPVVVGGWVAPSGGGATVRGSF